MKNQQKIEIISPIDGRIVAERYLASDDKIAHVLSAAVKAQSLWKQTPLEERADFCLRAIEYMLAHCDELAEELTLQIGRPIRDTPGEIKGLAARGHHMVEIAEKALRKMQSYC